MSFEKARPQKYRFLQIIYEKIVLQYFYSDREELDQLAKIETYSATSLGIT